MGETWWCRAVFRGDTVWLEVDEQGSPKVQGGKVTIAYSWGAAKTYATFPDRVVLEPGTTPRAGKPAAAAPRGQGADADQAFYGGTADGAAAEGSVHLWTDGACTGNPGPAGAGAVLLWGGQRVELARWLGPGTNNIAELTAILVGIQALPRPLPGPLVIHTDSQYAIGVLARGWKAKANPELIAEIRAALRPLGPVIWHWLRGHRGVALNERCDALARQAIAQRKDWTG